MGNHGTILTSSDGTTWTSRSSGLSGGLGDTFEIIKGVTYGNNMFVAVGYGVLIYSSDGITWTPIDPKYYFFLYAVHYGNSKFVATGSSGWSQTSSDGITWTYFRDEINSSGFVSITSKE